MKIIQKYAANDGTEFPSAEACLAHENLCAAVLREVEKLPPARKDNAFLNGEGFIQHERGAFLAFQRFLIDQLALVWSGFPPRHLDWAREHKFPIGMTIIGRYMADCAPAPVSVAWHRVMCADNNFREYGQPFFAIRANKSAHS